MKYAGSSSRTSIGRRSALAAIAGACATPLLGRGAIGQEQPLRLATAPLDVSAEPYYAMEMGFFKRAGLSNVTLQTIPTGAAMTAAVAGGAIDIAISNIVSVAQAHQRNVPFTLVAPAGLYTSSAPTSVLMVAKDSPLRTAADLNGKTLGASGLRGIAQFAPMAWIDQHGGSSAAVKFVEMSSPEIIAAVSAGRVDGGLIIEPFIAEAKKTMRVFANVFDAIAPAFLISAHFADLEWAKAHTDVVRRYQTAIAETAAWANKNRPQSALILIKAANLKEDVVRSMTRIEYANKISPELVQPVIDTTAKYTGAPPFRAAEIIFSA
jgi:NitT/TauT family transport system substrate-binding protein